MHKTQKDGLIQMADPEGEIYFYDDYDEAKKAAESTFFGAKFGYLIFARLEPQYEH